MHQPGGLALDHLGRFFLARPVWVAGLICLAMLALPVAIWMDLRNLSDQNMRAQANTLNQVITSIRSYYAENVVSRVNAGDGRTETLHTFRNVKGAIPIPATLSIELGEAISAKVGDVTYRFTSDYQFRNRQTRALSPFERSALAEFRTTSQPDQVLAEQAGTLWDRKVVLATPVILGAACVGCHNSHPESPKKDWRAGDVRGIQTVSLHQPIALNIWAFKWLLGYLAIAGAVGLIFALVQFRLARSFHGMNGELEANNAFLAEVSMKISKYLSPQIYRSIFSGERDVEIHTERKKLTVFFNDIKDFTATTERFQPEELTALLNEYFTEMSAIAHAHGATIDKFIGDAIVAFFGDPTTKGVAEDARACVKMALAMQQRLAELNEEWQGRGYEHPFHARIGINTGFCNVGNFGSAERMDYTIIGAEANLAARMEGIAKPGGIVMSYETWAHAKDMVDATALEPTIFKGIARQVVPYEVAQPSFEKAPGVQIAINMDAINEQSRSEARAALQRALDSFDQQPAQQASDPVQVQVQAQQPQPAERQVEPAVQAQAPIQTQPIQPDPIQPETPQNIQPPEPAQTQQYVKRWV